MIRTEQQLLDAVIDLAEHCRWAVHHDRPARRSGGQWMTAIQGRAGFPDLVLARRGVVIFRELKGYDARGRLGKLSPEQRDWARQIIDPGIDWNIPRADPLRLLLRFDVWTPDDFDSIIRPTLTARVTSEAHR